MSIERRTNRTIIRKRKSNGEEVKPDKNANGTATDPGRTGSAERIHPDTTIQK